MYDTPNRHAKNRIGTVMHKVPRVDPEATLVKQTDGDCTLEYEIAKTVEVVGKMFFDFEDAAAPYEEVVLFGEMANYWERYDNTGPNPCGMDPRPFLQRTLHSKKEKFVGCDRVVKAFGTPIPTAKFAKASITSLLENFPDIMLVVWNRSQLSNTLNKAVPVVPGIIVADMRPIEGPSRMDLCFLLHMYTYIHIHIYIFRLETEDFKSFSILRPAQTQLLSQPHLPTYPPPSIWHPTLYIYIAPSYTYPP